MKNVFYILLFTSLFLGGCEQNQIDTWEDDGRIGLYFFVPDNQENKSDPVIYSNYAVYETGRWSSFTETLFSDPAMSSAARDMYESLVAYSSGYPAYYLGEEHVFEPDTITILVGYTGLPKDGFTYRLQAWPEKEQDSIAPFSYVRCADDPEDLQADELYFPGNHVQYDTLHLLMEQPERYGDYKFQIGIDTAGVQFAGIEEWNRWHLEVNYSYKLNYGTEWPEAWLGEFSDEKHMFLQTVLHLCCDRTFSVGLREYSNEQIKTYIWQPLQDALAEYNAAHPGVVLTLPAESELPEGDEIWWEEETE